MVWRLCPVPAGLPRTARFAIIHMPLYFTSSQHVLCMYTALRKTSGQAESVCVYIRAILYQDLEHGYVDELTLAASLMRNNVLFW